MVTSDEDLTRERFGFTVFLSTCFHAIIILGVGFTYLEELHSEPALDITMAHYRSKFAPVLCHGNLESGLATQFFKISKTNT